MRVGALLPLLAAAAGLAIGPSAALADTADVAATQTYLQANYAFVRYFTSHIPAARAEISSVLAGVRRECPSAAAGSPENVDSEQLSNEVIGTMVTTVVQHNLPPIRTAIRATAHLRWSNGALTRAIQAYAAKGKVLTSLAVPHLCADVKAWVAGDFQTLPASTASFAPRFMSVWVAPGYLPAALSPYETAEDRTLAHRTAQLEEQWTEFEAYEVETWGKIMNALVLQP
ncbi:MAG: hypothetical protein ACLPUT_01465 [Solirubrobacteraceae bacterium]|jgi:hypothetical protein